LSSKTPVLSPPLKEPPLKESAGLSRSVNEGANLIGVLDKTAYLFEAQIDNDVAFSTNELVVIHKPSNSRRRNVAAFRARNRNFVEITKSHAREHTCEETGSSSR
jgi:hypothetical protein